MSEEVAEGGTNKILLLETDAAGRAACAAALSRAGFEVQAAADANEARHLLLKHEWSLVILDLESAEADGETIHDEIRESPLRWVPLIGLSRLRPAISDPQSQKEAWLGRPFELEQLVRLSSTLIERDRLYRKIATVDPTTGALSHRAAREALAEEIIRAERSYHPVAVAVLNIDLFDSINHTHGHRVGDQVMSELVWLFKARMRRTDRIGRFGGGQFLVVLPETKVEGALQALENRRAEYEELVFSGRSGDFHVTLSVGAASYPDDAEAPGELVDRALDALARARRAGGNRVEIFQQLV
ncbi:MAG: diguanylate cyclase [Candidatus Schekmanbacteria bacterium]|nr:diguanylate cyclase [Candidatus Schekmanbacteria bacterium]